MERSVGYIGTELTPNIWQVAKENVFKIQNGNILVTSLQAKAYFTDTT